VGINAVHLLDDLLDDLLVGEAEAMDERDSYVKWG
jgi:hypothetical protein